VSSDRASSANQNAQRDARAYCCAAQYRREKAAADFSLEAREIKGSETRGGSTKAPHAHVRRI
jgi:hypothetical protein